MNHLTNFIETRFKDNIRTHFKTDYKSGDYSDFPDSLEHDLIGALHDQNIKNLYLHQIDAFHSITNNNDTLLISNTASGKTLSFFLPVFNEYMKASPPFSVLLMYPTKALSRDQENTFGKLMSVVKKSGKLGTFDGDTPRDERSRIQKSADFIITNPDMLHSGILPNHNRRWKTFLSRLKFIIVDEVHMYRGAFGSHVSNVFRRLLRICSIHGSSPSFICSSATVGNPGELASSLFHRKFNIIDKDSAPKPERNYYFINPPLVKSHGFAQYRKGTGSVSVPLIRKAAKQNIRTICFCRSRQEVERLYRSVTDKRNDLKKIIKPYRGGLLPNERRDLERKLLNGELKVVICTNALELGIDIGDLELCIMSGYPGTVASFRQQAGRVGRKGNRSAIVFISKDSPIDQYIVNNSDFIHQTSSEHALLNADNPYIFLQHLPCMAHEHPLRNKEMYTDPLIYDESVEILKSDKTIVPYKNNLRYALQDYPARGVNLRGLTDFNIEIYYGSEVIGELDPIGARGTLYKDAIYQHLGKRYMSMDLDLEKKLCRVDRVDVDYFTEAVWEGRVNLTDSDQTKVIHDAFFELGFITVNKQPKMYKKIRERSYENIGYGPITLPAFEYDTSGFCMKPPPNWLSKIEKKDIRFSGAAMYGFGYILRHAAPSICMADKNDLNTDVYLSDKNTDTWNSSLFLYDTIDGGVGYSEKVFENIDVCLKLCLDIIKTCECRSGCPSCIPSLPPGVDDEDLETFLVESDASKKCTISLLNALVFNKIELPEVTIHKVPLIKNINTEPDNLKQQEVRNKLNRAATMLRKKRERLH